MSYQQEKFKEIADKIREKTGTEDAIKPSDFADKLTEVFDAGKEACRREQWNNKINSLKNGWSYGFAGRTWNDETFTPYTDISMSAGYNITGLFTYSAITDLKGILEKYNASLDLSLGANSQNLFANSKVTRIPKLILSDATTLNTAFNGCTDLTSIDELSVPKIVNATNAFYNCTNLREIRISGELKVSVNFGDCPLSQASVESIVAALSDNVTGQTVTFKNSQIELINGATSWWADLVASKPNWTFALLDV